MLGFLKNVPSGLDSLAMMARFRLIAVAEVVSSRRGFIPSIILVSFALAACASFERRSVPASSAADFREYVVYRIDDNRYITIRSKHPCGFGQLDGQIFYYDIHRNVRTMVSFTGGMANGLYGGYYAIQSDSKYIAIPSLSFSETRGMMLRINYSHDGGRTFQWFLTGYDNRPDYAVIQKENYLYLTIFDQKSSRDDFDRFGTVLDIGQDMDYEISHYDNPTSALDVYGKSIARRQIPLGMKSPSGATKWICPAISSE